MLFSSFDRMMGTIILTFYTFSLKDLPTGPTTATEEPVQPTRSTEEPMRSTRSTEEPIRPTIIPVLSTTPKQIPVRPTSPLDPLRPTRNPYITERSSTPDQGE